MEASSCQFSFECRDAIQVTRAREAAVQTRIWSFNSHMQRHDPLHLPHFSSALRLKLIDHEPDVSHRVDLGLLPPRTAPPHVLPANLDTLPPRKTVPFGLLGFLPLPPRAPARPGVPFPSQRDVFLPESDERVERFADRDAVSGSGSDVERMREDYEPEFGEGWGRDALGEDRVRSWSGSVRCERCAQLGKLKMERGSGEEGVQGDFGVGGELRGRRERDAVPLEVEDRRLGARD